jgi:hypothetical protein
VLGEHVLPDPGRCPQDSFGLQVRPWTGGSPAGDLLAQFGFEDGDIKSFLAQQGKLAAGLQAGIRATLNPATGAPVQPGNVNRACRIRAHNSPETIHSVCLPARPASPRLITLIP